MSSKFDFSITETSSEAKLSFVQLKSQPPCPPRGPILRIVKTMLSDRDVCVRRLREGYEFFRSMSERRE